MRTIVSGKAGANVEFVAKLAFSVIDGLAYMENLPRQNEVDRIAIEGKFGEGKRRYGLDLINAKLRETSETAIIINLIVMNLARGYRALLSFFKRALFLHLKLVFYASPGGLYPLRRRVLGNMDC